MFATQSPPQIPAITFAGNPVTITPLPNGDYKFSCTVDTGGPDGLQTREGLASQIRQFVESGYRMGYFGDTPMSLQGDKIQIGCLKHDKAIFDADYAKLKALLS